MPLPPFLRWLSPAHAKSEKSVAATERIQEQINPTAMASSPTQEDWYWGRLATGGEEDYYWRRLSDNWYVKNPMSKDMGLSLTRESRNERPLDRATHQQRLYRCWQEKLDAFLGYSY